MASSPTPGATVRLAHYVFRAGLNPKCNLKDRKMPDMNPDSSNPDLSQVADSKDDIHPLTYRYDADTIYRFPKEDISELEIYPPYTPMFCFPSDISFISHENGKPPDTFHSFVITESNGSKTYGVCLKTHVFPSAEHASQIENMISKWREQNLAASDYEFAQHVQAQLAFEKERLLKIKLGMTRESRDSTHATEETITVLEELITPLRQSILIESENIYIPTCLGILSKYPFYDLLKDWLCLVVHGIQTADFDRFPMERCITNLIYEIPLPPPGKLEISIPFDSYKLYISRPPINNCQLLKNYSSYPLFRSMSLENIVTMFELLITEYKIVLLSEHASILTIICETLCSWLYPLYWHHILIPILPGRLLGYLQAPVPYLVGIQKQSFKKWAEEDWRPIDAAVIDVDNDIIDFPTLKVKIPLKERKKLLLNLEKYSGQGLHSIKKGVPETLKYAFPLNKVCISISSISSTIDYRKIRDIPRSMYFTYSNTFLKEKSGALRDSPVKNNPASQTTSVRSFDIPAAPEDNNDDFRVSVSKESIMSFGSSEQTSDVVPSPKFSNNIIKIEDTKEKISNASISIPIPSLSSPNTGATPSSTTATFPNTGVTPSPTTATSPSKIGKSWWKFSPTATSPSIQKPEKPSFFGKYLHGKNEEAHQMAISSIHRSGDRLPEKLSATSAGTSPLQNPPVTYHKEGHLFHLLVLAENIKAEVDSSPSENGVHDSEEFVDRFTPDSGSSDDMSRSDMSTTTDSRFLPPSNRQQRSAGQSRTLAAVTSKKSLSSIPVRNISAYKVKRNTLIAECEMCQDEIHPTKHNILMCQYCHIQIHEKCLALTEGAPCEVHFNPEKIATCFFKIFTSTFRYYRNYMKVAAGTHIQENAEETSMAQWFKKVEFINEFDSESRPFVTVLLETQAFAQFVLDRVERPEDDYEILFFDESIKQKRNRSRMRFTKEATPFLSENSYRISKTVEAPAFDRTNIPLESHNSLDPFEWNSEFETVPRAVQKLVTESDQQMMRSHTNELVTRARLNSKTKYDFTKWLKLRWKSGEGKIGEDGFGNSFVSDDQRREALEEQVKQVNFVIDQFEAAHISSQSQSQLENALSVLTEQNQKLLVASEEEQVVDNYLFQHTLVRLMRVLSIYQEQTAKFPPRSVAVSPRTLPPPLPPRKQPSSPIDTSKNFGVSNWVSTVPVHRLGEDKSSSCIREGIEDDIGKASHEDLKRSTISQRDYLTLEKDLEEDAISESHELFQDVLEYDDENPEFEPLSASTKNNEDETRINEEYDIPTPRQLNPTPNMELFLQIVSENLDQEQRQNIQGNRVVGEKGDITGSRSPVAQENEKDVTSTAI